MTDAARWKATVYVGGLAHVVTVATLHDAFLPFGDIADVTLPKNENPNSKATEPHRGFAYVEYEDADDAKEAIDNMDQSEFFGRVIKVTAAKAPKSADEGLGSKKAVWEQVCRHALAICEPGADKSCFNRRVGWRNTLSARRTDLLPIKPRLQGIQEQKTQCKASKGWMWLALARLKWIADGRKTIPSCMICTATAFWWTKMDGINGVILLRTEPANPSRHSGTAHDARHLYKSRCTVIPDLPYSILPRSSLLSARREIRRGRRPRNQQPGFDA